MKIRFNGGTIDTDCITLAKLLLEQGVTAESHIATAVNGQFVSKDMRNSQLLNEGDQVEVVAPMQGG